MTKTILQLVVLFILLIIAQVVCYKILLFGVAVPIVFIYLILRLPINWNLNINLTVAFLMGLLVDITCDTPGLNALCCTLLAALRYPVFALYVPRENDLSNPIPSTDTLGTIPYLKYMATLVVIYCALIFTVQAFTTHNWLQTLIRIAASSLLTVIILLPLDSMLSTRHEKRV